MAKKRIADGKIRFLKSQSVSDRAIQKALEFHEQFPKCMVWIAQQCEKNHLLYEYTDQQWRLALDYANHKQQHGGWNINDYTWQRVFEDAEHWHRQIEEEITIVNNDIQLETMAERGQVRDGQLFFINPRASWFREDPKESLIIYTKEGGFQRFHTDPEDQIFLEEDPRRLEKRLRLVKWTYQSHDIVWSGSGYEVVKLKPADCQIEGNLMGHCVGSYKRQVSEGTSEIYSLRDSKNNPHVTIEVRHGKISQLYGKSNKMPVEKYQIILEDWLVRFHRDKKWRLDEIFDVMRRWFTYRPEKLEKIALDQIKSYTCFSQAVQHTVSIGERWKDLESLLEKNTHNSLILGVAIEYAIKVLKKPWKELEFELLKEKNFNLAVIYASGVKGQWLNFENLIYKRPWYAFKYTKQVLKGKRFKSAEPFIAKSALNEDYLALVGYKYEKKINRFSKDIH